MQKNMQNKNVIKYYTDGENIAILKNGKCKYYLTIVGVAV